MKINRVLIGLLFLSVCWLFYNQLQTNHTAYIISDNLVSEYQGMKDAKIAYQQKQAIWNANIDSLRVQYQSALKSDQGNAPIYLENLNKYSSQIQLKATEEDLKMTQTVLDQINNFTELYGEKHGYDMIFGTSSDGNILYGTSSKDITEEILDAINHYYATGEVK